MKKIISILLASTMLFSFTAPTFAADSSFSESCGHIENPTRFNPTDLSDYQKCWIDFYKADQASGMIGDLFWMRLGDDTISLTRGEIRAGGGESVVRSAIEQWVIDNMAEVVAGRISAAEDRIEALGADLQAALADADSKAAEISSLEADLAAMTAARDALQATVDGEAARQSAAVSAAVAPLNTRIMGLQADLMAARNDYSASQREVMRLTGELQTMTTNYNTVNNTSHATEMDAFTAGQADVRDNDPLYNNEDGVNQTHVNDVDVDWSFDAANDLIELRIYERNGAPDLFYQIPEATIISMLGINVEDGHGSTVSVANGVVTITGAGAATYVIEDGVNQSHVDAVVASSAQVSTDNRFLRVTLSNGNTADFNISSVYQAGVDSVTAEDGHHSTVAVSTDGNTLTVTGASAATHDLLNGRLLASQAHVDALADITTARATLAGMGFTNADFNVAMNDALTASATALTLALNDVTALQADLNSISGIAGQRGFTTGTVVQRVQALANAYGAVTVNAATRSGHVINGEGAGTITVRLTNAQSATISFTVNTPAGVQVADAITQINGITGHADITATATATDFATRAGQIQGVVTAYANLLTLSAAGEVFTGAVPTTGSNFDTDLSDGGGDSYDSELADSVFRNTYTIQGVIDNGIDYNGRYNAYSFTSPTGILEAAIMDWTGLSAQFAATGRQMNGDTWEAITIGQFVNQVTEVIWETGYDHGYSDGYDDGYEDGYRDGFRDGYRAGSA